MGDPGAVDRADGFREGDHESLQPVAAERPGRVHLLEEGGALDVGHRQIRLVTVGVGVEQLDDAATGNAPGGEHLPAEPGAEGLVGREQAAHDLQGDGSVGAVGEVDDPHAPLAQAGPEGVRAQRPRVVGVEGEGRHGRTIVERGDARHAPGGAARGRARAGR